MKLFLVSLASLASVTGAAAKTTHRGKWIEVSVGDKTFKVTDFKAKGDGKTDDTAAVQAAFDKAASAGGGTVYFPPGHNYLVSAFHFSSSNTVMEVPLGARVVFDDNQKKYDGKHDLIEAIGYSNVGIIGGGVIDGKGSKWWACREKNCFRPKMLHFKHGEQVLMKDVTFKDSPNHVLEVGTDYTELDHVTVFAPPSTNSDVSVNGTKGPSHNTDAVDVHGEYFYIQGCHFDTGDDNIAVHASHLLVEDCKFGHGHGTSIGSLGSDIALRNITIRNSEFRNTGTAVKIKTRAGSKNSFLHDVTWENLDLYNVKQSIAIDMFYDHGKMEKTDFDISNITIRGIKAHGSKTEDGKSVTPGIFHCQESSPCRGIHLQDIHHFDVKASFDCYNAFGDYTNDVDSSPCLKGNNPGPSPTPDPTPAPTPSSRRRRRRKQGADIMV